MTAHARCGYTPTAWLGLPLWTRIRLAASFYCGWGYLADHPRVAYQSPGVPDSMAVLHTGGTNCSTLTTSLVTAARPDLPWSMDEYADLQVWDAQRIASPVEAVQRIGAGVQIERLSSAPGVYLFQGWRSTKPLRGHALLGKLHADGLLELIEAQPDRGVHWNRSSLIRLKGRYPAALYVARLHEGESTPSQEVQDAPD